MEETILSKRPRQTKKISPSAVWPNDDNKMFYAMNTNEIMNKNNNFQQIIITTQIFGSQWYLYKEHSFPFFYFINNDKK